MEAAAKEQARKRARVWSKTKAKTKINVNVGAKNISRSGVEKTMTGEMLTSIVMFLKILLHFNTKECNRMNIFG